MPHTPNHRYKMSGKKVKVDKNGKELTPKQKKIASLAPPRNKITGADFRALRNRRKK
tara:strand:+ start:708 stop:878 length:171 start_codon:yes stop_codon:yes gene_type:complete